MNREILFRGKRLDNGEWLYGAVATFLNLKAQPYTAIIPFVEGINYMPDLWAVDPDTVSQFTGLTDKNGVKIFEGDCIQIPDSGEAGVIRYGKYRQPCDDVSGGHIGFYVNWVSEESKYCFRRDVGYWHERFDIIGNIHDNKELLKGGEVE